MSKKTLKKIGETPIGILKKYYELGLAFVESEARCKELSKNCEVSERNAKDAIAQRDDALKTIKYKNIGIDERNNEILKLKRILETERKEHSAELSAMGKHNFPEVKKEGQNDSRLS